jgi:hypothetical protein
MAEEVISCISEIPLNKFTQLAIIKKTRKVATGKVGAAYSLRELPPPNKKSLDIYTAIS